MIASFQFSSLPRIIFGAGKRTVLAEVVKTYGSSVLLVTGTSSIYDSGHGDELLAGLKEEHLHIHHETIGSEPSPGMVDEIVEKYKGRGIDIVVAIGGGSVMDAGKAISALMLVEYSARRYLEGVGDLEHPGVKLPFIAMPTTSGTGSEVTKNAVLSEVGEKGYKKSLRHENFIPDVAIVDPEMTLTCPPRLTATSGMDAFTQLLESYLSRQANPLTDALALQGLKHVKKYLLRAFLEGENNLEARAGMALAALFSGITLAHAGLGLVHGFASPLGGHFNIPHGLVCGTLMAPVNAATIDKLLEDREHPAFKKYLIVSKVFSDFKYKEDREYLLAFKDKLEHITKVLEVPMMSASQFDINKLDPIISETSHKHHPVKLSEQTLKEILLSRLEEKSDQS